MSDTSALIERLTELLGKATPGPWDAPDDSLCDGRHVFAKGLTGSRFVLANCKASQTFVTESTREGDRANAALIVAAVNELPGLLAEITRLTERVERARGMLAATANEYPDHSGDNFESDCEICQMHAAVRTAADFLEETK